MADRRLRTVMERGWQVLDRIVGFAFRRHRACRTTFAVKALFLCAALGGCSTMQGAPEPVTTPEQAREDLSPYLSGDVLAKFYATDAAERLGMSPLAWRDSVIAARLEVTDQNYMVFTNAMRAETSGVNLGTNLAALGLS